jgi:Cu2+-exporting ATPase
VVDGVERVLCCPGCKAACELVVSSGLEAYYQYRDIAYQKGETTTSVRNDELEKLAYNHLDLPGIQKSFVEEIGSNLSEASIVVSGLRCAACVWLLESFLSRQKGVEDVHVNLSSQRAYIQFNPDKVPVSELFIMVHRLGYEPIPYKPSAVQLVYQQERSNRLKQLGVAGIILMQVMMLSIALYAGEFQGMQVPIESLFRYASMLLLVPVVFYSAWPFFRGAYIDIKSGSPGMDLPVALAIGSAFTFSVFNTLSGRGAVYFDSVSMFTFFLLLGKYLEFQARYHSHRTANDLLSVFPVHATLLSGETRRQGKPESELSKSSGSVKQHQEQIVLVEELKPGDVVLVNMGAIVPIDGSLLSECAQLDQSALSGESTPVERNQGDMVFAGSINLEGPIRLAVDSIVSETIVSRIIRLSERATREKPRIANVADKLARKFVIFVILAACATGLWWGLSEPERAFAIVLSVLVISCPCALSLATPAALTVATSALARQGFLISKGHVIERLASVKDVVFDKTGTLTMGKLNIEQIIPLTDLTAESCLAIAAGLESGIEHPVAKAFSRCPGKAVVSNRQLAPGEGVKGVVEGKLFCLGKPSFALPEQPVVNPGGSGLWLLLSEATTGPVAWFRAVDQIRADSAPGVQYIQSLGVGTHLLTGDTEVSGAEVGHRLSISSVSSEVLPDQKMTYIQQFQAVQPEVVMVGDGINDIAALSSATTSITMADASDFVQSKTDAVLLSNRVMDIGRAIEFARKTRRVIRQNLAWALAYNLIALPLAMSGLIAPWLAALGMSSSSLLVVCNAWRLRTVDR